MYIPIPLLVGLLLYYNGRVYSVGRLESAEKSVTFSKKTGNFSPYCTRWAHLELRRTQTWYILSFTSLKFVPNIYKPEVCTQHLLNKIQDKKHHHHPIKNLFLPWNIWKIPHLALNNNHSISIFFSRFLGSTQESSNILFLLQSLTNQIRKIFDFPPSQSKVIEINIHLNTGLTMIHVSFPPVPTDNKAFNIFVYQYFTIYSL